MAEGAGSRVRHRWVKVRLHVYICRQCGAGKVNAQDASGKWFATFHLPTGKSGRSSLVPACRRGPLTDTYLAKYAALLAAPPF